MAVSDEIVSRVDSIGTIPTAVTQVLGMLNDPAATLSDFEKVVRPDPGLTANLLKSANSAYYRGSREITSVRDAIMRMGLKRVLEVAAGATFARTIPPVLVGYGVDADALWTHSVAVAVLADLIGREVGFTYPDLAFTAGLLHDVGKVVVASWVERTTQRLEAVALCSVEKELDVLGTTHAELGQALCHRWNLPKDIGGAARWHHAPGDAPTATLRALATVVRLANVSASALEASNAAQPETVDAETLERAGLSRERLAELVTRAAPEVVRTCALLAGTH